jgi:hypothetical protein
MLLMGVIVPDRKSTGTIRRKPGHALELDQRRAVRVDGAQ